MLRWKSLVIVIIDDRHHRKYKSKRSAHNHRKPRTKPSLKQCVDARHKQQCLNHTSLIALQKKKQKNIANTNFSLRVTLSYVASTLQIEEESGAYHVPTPCWHTWLHLIIPFSQITIGLYVSVSVSCLVSVLHRSSKISILTWLPPIWGTRLVAIRTVVPSITM